MRCYDPRLMRALVDDDVDDGSASAETGRRTRIPSWITPAVVAVAVAVGVVLRFVQRSPLWLDEALSVNIASLPVGDMLDALRHDGHPPLYYLLLHYWIEVVGDGDMAVRALSGIFAVASLPLVWLAGRRLAGTAGGRWALVVAALSPYWVRYATETRMYSLVMLLVLAGYLLLVRALDEPTWPRLGGLAVVSGLLLLTHYWAFYLCAAGGAVMAQNQAFADVNMGFGVLLNGLAAVIVGETLIGRATLIRQIAAPVVGAIVYYQVISMALALGLEPSDLKFLTGAFVLAMLAIPGIAGRRETMKIRE